MSAAAARSPLVTVVTPCLDPGWRLERCIASVAAQTYAHVEHVVVDGASTDGTVELLRGTPSVKWVSEPDSGQTDAINKGFAMGGGEILTWLNADDELLPDAVEKAVACFADPAIGWSYANTELVYPDKTQTWVAPATLRPDSFDWIMPFPQQGWFIARWALDRVGPLDETFHLSMDYDLCLRLFTAGIPHCYVPSTLARFEVHAESKTGSTSYVAFIDEGARAMRKAGRLTAFYMAMGQRCAYLSAEDDRVDRARLRAEVLSTVADHAGRPRRDRAAVKAGAYTAAAQIELKSERNPKPLRSLGWLLRPEPWRFGVTRGRSMDLAKTAVRRRLGGSPRSR
ncbi:MAG TPA: glycosyltransferase family 2 protein [Actinomycetota bacterium]|nr:glycosyltransferase family 2 protein [Actinomycetota bacterium]